MIIVTMPTEMWREENFRKEKMMTTMVMEITEISWSTRMTINDNTDVCRRREGGGGGRGGAVFEDDCDGECYMPFLL